MANDIPVIEVRNLVRRYGKLDAVNGLNLTVQPGRCYGFFGRNGAGKTTTIKCLLNLLKPMGGEIRLFGLDPQKAEAAVKARLTYVPDAVAFYPWMSIRQLFDYLASFRTQWNRAKESELLERLNLDPGRRVDALSRGEKVQVALIGALCPEPELLILDEPTSGLDPLVRRDFIRTIIGAYQEADPGRRTVFVSTHLISEFEGLIDQFTVIDKGREVLTLDADAARDRFRKVRVRFGQAAPDIEPKGALQIRREGREWECVVNGQMDQFLAELKALKPESVETESLCLEEVFLTVCRTADAAR